MSDNIGYKLDRKKSRKYYDVWSPTADLDDAALPSDEFRMGSSTNVAEWLEGRNPSPEGTYRVAGRYGVIVVYKHPVLTNDLDAWARNRYHAGADELQALREMLGTHRTLLARRTIDGEIRRNLGAVVTRVGDDPQSWRGSGGLYAITPAPESTRKKYAVYATSAARRAEAARAAEAAKAAERERARREAAARDARLAPAAGAVAALGKAITAAIEAEADRAPLCAELRYLPAAQGLTLGGVNTYDRVVRKSHRDLREFKKALAAVEALAAEDRNHLFITAGGGEILTTAAPNRKARKAAKEPA